jgi:hypothetical protein
MTHAGEVAQNDRLACAGWSWRRTIPMAASGNGVMVERQDSEQPAVRGRRNLVSNLLAVAAVIFAIIAIVLYAQGSRTGGIAPIPTPAAGSLQIVNVTEALKAQGLDVKQPPGLFIPSTELGTPGQGVEVDGIPAFVFLFKTEEAAREALDGIEPESLVPERLAGTRVPAGQRHLVQGRDVAILVVGGDETLWQKVDAAVAGLP